MKCVDEQQRGKYGSLYAKNDTNNAKVCDRLQCHSTTAATTLPDMGTRQWGPRSAPQHAYNNVICPIKVTVL